MIWGEIMRSLIVGALLWMSPFHVASEAWGQSLEPYAAIPVTWNSVLSPEGNWLATGCEASGRRSVCVFNLQTGGLEQAFSPTGQFRLHDFYFPSESYLIMDINYVEEVEFTSGFQSIPIARSMALNLETGNTEFLLRSNSGFSNTTNVVSFLADEPDKVLFELLYVRSDNSGAVQRNRESTTYRSMLVEADLESGVSRTRSRDNDILYRIFNAEGDVVVNVSFDRDRNDMTVRRASGSRQVLYEGEHVLDRPSVGAFLDESGLLFTFPEGPRRGHYRLDIETGELTELGVGTQGNLYTPVVDEVTQRIVAFQVMRGGRPVYLYLDDDLGTDAERLAGALGVEEVIIFSWTQDRSLLLFQAADNDPLGAHYLYDRANGSVSIVAQSYPDITPEMIGAVEPYHYEASDGLEIEGFLTWPADHDRSDGPLPLVVMPHGGPYARDSARFDWWAQAYASMGYLVLQPNFRGSSGYGESFTRAGYGEFGGKMIEDILDGARSLQADGLAQEGQYCLAGASYGGYAVLMGAIRAPEEVACVIAHSPVTRPLSMIGDAVRSDARGATEFWERYMGSRFMSGENERAMSPGLIAEQIRAPLLVVHGVDDTTVPIEQSDSLASVLNDRADFEYQRIEDDDHYLSRVASRRLLLERSRALLQEHLPAE